MHPALKRSVFVHLLLGLEHLQEVGQADPAAALAPAFAHVAGQIAGEFLAIPVDGCAYRD